MTEFYTTFEATSDAQKKYAIAIGYFMIEWNMLERRLAFLFQQLTGLSQKQADAIFFSTKAYMARKDLLEAAISSSDRAPDFTKACADVVRRCNAIVSKRNSAAHDDTALWLGDEGVTMFGYSPKKPYPVTSEPIQEKTANGLWESIHEEVRPLSTRIFDVYEAMIANEPSKLPTPMP